MNIAEIIVAIGGLSGIILATPPVLKEIRAWRSGRAMVEKQRNRSAIGRVAQLEDELEEERTFRFAFQEYAGKVRLMIIQMGCPEDKLPPWPVRAERVSP